MEKHLEMNETLRRFAVSMITKKKDDEELIEIAQQLVRTGEVYFSQRGKFDVYPLHFATLDFIDYTYRIPNSVSVAYATFNVEKFLKSEKLKEFLLKERLLIHQEIEKKTVEFEKSITPHKNELNEIHEFLDVLQVVYPKSNH